VTAPSGLKVPEHTEVRAYGFGPWRLVPAERILRRGGEIIHLPPKAFETLLLLVRHAGHLLRKEDLMKALWPDTFVEEVNLANKISLLRRVLGDTGRESVSIQTVSKQGYRFLPAVTRILAAGPSPAGAALASPVDPERAVRFIALPFAVTPGDENIAFLGHSLPEAIAASLASLRSITVRSSLLAARLAEELKDPRQIAQEADVDMLLTGRIMCDGPELRVTAELVHAPSAGVTGAWLCQTGLQDVFEIQDNLVHRIVEQLAPRLSERERRTLAHDVPSSARAYEFYLRGTHVERDRTFDNISMARDLYRQCLDEDPDYAPAWAHLGRCYRFLEKFDPQGPNNPELTRWAFHRAFALNPDLPIAHDHYTQIEADSGHAMQAMVRLLRQAEKHPNAPELFTGLVQATRYCGLLEESLRAHHRARLLDSHAVTSVAHTYFLLADYAGALQWYPPGLRFYMDAAALAAAGRENEAAELLRHRPFSAPMVDSLRDYLEGDLAKSIGVIRNALHPGVTADPEIRFYLARQLARDGAGAEALEAIRLVAGEGFFCSTALRRDPWLQVLSCLPGFTEVLSAVLSREGEAREAFRGASGELVLG